MIKVIIGTIIIFVTGIFTGVYLTRFLTGTPDTSKLKRTLEYIEITPFTADNAAENKTGLEDTIIVTTPGRNQEVTSPLFIEGRARGTWFFEASAPVTLMDDNGETLAQGHVQANGDWMSEDFVDFNGEINFDPKSAGAGTLVLRNDNPSGMPENELRLEIPVIFK